MTQGFRVLVQPAAQRDIANALEWYGQRGIGLADRFLDALDETMGIIVRMPDAFPAVHRNVRRAMMRTLPPAVFTTSSTPIDSLSSPCSIRATRAGC